MSVFPKPTLSDQLHPLIQDLANSILEIWHTQLSLSVYDLPEDLGYVEGRLEGEKLIIENCCFQTPQFRKLHLELAKAGSGLDILHCVMFPQLTYDLPMFGCDIVAGRGQVSAAIVDLSPLKPMGEDLEKFGLPDGYSAELDRWQSQGNQFQQRRELPEWGTIFSPYCLFIRPINAQEEQAFLDATAGYLKLHCQQAQIAAGTADPHQIYAAHFRYSQQQRQNDRTRRVLEKAFGVDWADRYMTTVLFDLPPQP